MEETEVCWCSGHLGLSFANKTNVTPSMSLGLAQSEQVHRVRPRALLKPFCGFPAALRTSTKMLDKADRPRALAWTLSL